MPSLRDQLPYASPIRSSDDPLMCRLQSYILLADKRTVLAAVGGDDAIISYVFQHAFKRTADFIRANGLNLYDPANYNRVLAFIRDGSDTCPSGNANVQHDVGPSESSQSKTSPASSVNKSSGQVSPRGARTEKGGKSVKAAAGG